ncbi:secreted protein, putative, partial [Ixodes scapularis]
MADELVFLTGNSPMLVLSAVLGLLVVLIIFVAGQKRDGDDKETNETEADKQTARKENRAVPKRKKVQEKKRDIKTQYLHPWLMTTLKGHSGNILDLDFNVNGKFLATSADGKPSKLRFPFFSALFLKFIGGGHVKKNNVAGTPLGAPSPLEGAWRLPLCPDDLYHQLLCYTLTPQELHRCGYPRPCPGEPGRAVWFQVDAPGADASHRTCCRCGAAFVITAGGEYYASDACVF